MTAALLFEVAIASPLSQTWLEPHTFVTEEPAALEAASELVERPRVEQVTIEATTIGGLPGATFAMRHFKHDGRTITTGEWSCWEDGVFTGHRPTLEGWLA